MNNIISAFLGFLWGVIVGYLTKKYIFLDREESEEEN